MKVGRHSAFEDAYMAKFREIAQNYGVFVEYARDVAARDIGLHFTQPHRSGDRIVTPSLAWFQMKGIHAATLTAEAIKEAGAVQLQLDTRHLIFWYMQPAPTYLTTYAEATDEFYIINIKDWVANTLGDEVLTTSQQSFTISIPTTEKLDDHAFRIILNTNLIPIMRSKLDADDQMALRFLRDAELVKWLDRSTNAGVETRLRIIKWMSKTRTEVYFEERAPGDKEWRIVREHWQYMMDRIGDAFPYLNFEPDEQADADDVYEFVDFDTNRLLPTDDEYEWEPETLLEISRGVISVGEMYAGEVIEHCLGISLNAIGQTWARSIEILEKAEIIAVTDKPSSFVSVAPWHARKL